jgi:lactase-phlorizin hydrolase
LQIVPWGFRKLLNWIAKEYKNPPVFITENGFSDHGELNDRDRVDYLIVSGSISLFLS